MAKKLSEDEIKFILSVESSAAQQEIHKLMKETKQLNRTNQERRNIMRSLEAQGKKDTEYYRNLEAEVKATTEAISKNKKMVGELEKKLDVTGLTMAQLKAKAKDLRHQLDHTAKASHPEEYARLEEELNRVNDRMRELRNTGAYARKELSGFEKTMNLAKTAAKGFVAVQLLSYLKSVGASAYSTRKEFARYEAVLKNATGSGKEASAVMQTLQQLASDTPASVAEWTEAYIKLVNRGLKPTTSELTAMGDIATSQGKDIDQFIEALLDAMTGENERLKEFGITAKKNGETTAYTFKGVTTEVQNTDQAVKNYILSLGKLQGVQGSMATQMKELGGLESNLGDQLDNIYNKIGKKLEPAIKSFMGRLGDLMGALSSSLDTNAEKFDTQMDKVVSLQNDLVPLLDRYDELKTKTNLSAQEQEEMNTLIARISQIMPAAITGFNQYGQAISISTDYAREWIQTEKDRLAYMNRSRIEQAQKDKKTLEEKLSMLAKQEELSKRLYGTDEEGQAKSIAVYNGGRSTNEAMNFRRASTKEQAAFRQQQQELLQQLRGVDAQLKQLQGETLEDMVTHNTETLKKRQEFNAMNKQQLDAWIADEKNAGSEYLQIAEEIRNSRFVEAASSDLHIKEQGNRVKKAIERQNELYTQQQIELKKRYLSGQDEQLKSQKAFNEAMDALALQDLQEKLKILGLELSERQRIEQQILDIRIKALEDYYARKKELEDAVTEDRKTKNQQAMEENEASAQEEMKIRGEELTKLREKTKQSLTEQVEDYKSYGSQIGSMLGSLFSDQEGRLEEFGEATINVLLDVLAAFIQSQITQVTATGVATTAKATTEAASTPQSALTGGAAGAVTAAILTGLIAAAVATAKQQLSGMLHKNKNASSGSSNNYTRVPGKAEGGYIDVTRQQDGKPFHAAYRPSARGFINRPTVIVGEGPAGMSREWVASNAAVMNPTVAPILSVIDQAQQAGTIRTLDLSRYLSAVTLRGKAEGGSVAPQASMPVPSADTEQLNRTMQALYALLNTIQRDGVHAYTLLSEVNKAQELQNRSRKIGSK